MKIIFWFFLYAIVFFGWLKISQYELWRRISIVLLPIRGFINILIIIKNWIIYNAIQEFSLLNHHGIWTIMMYKNSERMLDFLGLFIFIVVLVFYILGAFLIKQLFHLCLLDMRWLYTTQRYTPRWLSIISYPTRAHGIIVN